MLWHVHLNLLFVSPYAATPITVIVYPPMPTTVTGFLNSSIEITTATAPFALPSTWLTSFLHPISVYQLHKLTNQLCFNHTFT